MHFPVISPCKQWLYRCQMLLQHAYYIRNVASLSYNLEFNIIFVLFLAIFFPFLWCSVYLCVFCSFCIENTFFSWFFFLLVFSFSFNKSVCRDRFFFSSSTFFNLSSQHFPINGIIIWIFFTFIFPFFSLYLIFLYIFRNVAVSFSPFFTQIRSDVIYNDLHKYLTFFCVIFMF